jgi:hypothetical protein
MVANFVILSSYLLTDSLAAKIYLAKDFAFTVWAS